MPIRILEKEKEGHRKVKTDFRKEGKAAGGRTGLKHGTQRKVLTGDHPIVKALAGGVEGKPHSSKEGRLASARRKLSRIGRTNRRPVPWKKGKRAPFQGGGRTNLLEELGRVEGERSNKNRRAEISRVHGELNRGYAKGGRAGYGIGSIVKGAKKIISKIKPKPKPKGKEQRFLDFIETGKAVDKHGVKVNVPKAAERLTGKPHVDHGIRKKIKHLGKGKASGGRIGLSHGGSAGAAKRGHGAEIK